MVPSFDEIKSACTGVDDEFIREHIARLGARYFDRFSLPEIAAHLSGLRRLSGSDPVGIIASITADNNAEITLLAYDYPFAFSLITGILGVMGMRIIAGEAFTYRRSADVPLEIRRNEAFQRRHIIDRFSGVIESPVDHDGWLVELGKKLTAVFLLMEKGDAEDSARAKHAVNEMVAECLTAAEPDPERAPYPVEIHFDKGGGLHTRMHVVSVDTPFFLYALSTALSLRGISIELVRINTSGKMIRDEFDMVDSAGGRIEDERTINRIRLSVLLIREFSFFLGKAPDPFAALTRFENLVDDILKLPGHEKWIEILSAPRVLNGLARLLGASDFLWEDFIRSHYAAIIPMLVEADGAGLIPPAESIPQRLKAALSEAVTREDEVRILNAFKDREIYLADMEHILTPGAEYRVLSERLSALAGHVVSAAAEMAYKKLVSRYGIPRTDEKLEAVYSILGLGKMGGAALGYASDIELLFIYSGSGMTDGPGAVENSVFFSLLVREVIAAVKAKPEGIFSIDVRMRPKGRKGPLAASLESFREYYGPGGGAPSYERLALTRLRLVGGDTVLGKQIEKLRDEFMYVPRSFDIRSIREFRAGQFRSKTGPGRLNAKYSPGALVDLECSVQILQLMYGVENPSLRTPSIHGALAALAVSGVLPREESDVLAASYDFMRKLVNGLRMLRGSAGDIFLPPQDSDEYLHLAKRMGYEKRGNISPARLLHVEFETSTAMVRAFVERHIGWESLPGPVMANIADIVLADRLPDGLPERVLTELGFRDPARALVSLKRLSAAGMRRDIFARLAVLACGFPAVKSDPDRVFDTWGQFMEAVDSPARHCDLMLSLPSRLEILLGIFSSGTVPAGILVRNPGFLNRVAVPQNLHRNITGEMLLTELRDMCEMADSEIDCLSRMAVLHRRELLRIAVRDLVLNAPLHAAVSDLSRLAEALIVISLERAWLSLDEPSRTRMKKNGLRDRFCIIAFGRLGGQELSYAPELELLGVYDDAPPGGIANNEAHPRSGEIFSIVMDKVARDLSLSTAEGRAYSVVPGIRSPGGPGRLVYPMDELVAYISKDASPGEFPALLDMRPVAGSMKSGHDFIVRVWPPVLERLRGERMADIIRNLRGGADGGAERLSGAGARRVAECVRDIGVLVKGLRLVGAETHPDLLGGNTLQALKALAEYGILSAAAADVLKNDYLFLRKAEHFLQLSGEPPSSPREEFIKSLDEIRRHITEAYDRFPEND